MMLIDTTLSKKAHLTKRSITNTTSQAPQTRTRTGSKIGFSVGTSMVAP